jgi:hypothetical protein
MKTCGLHHIQTTEFCDKHLTTGMVRCEKLSFPKSRYPVPVPRGGAMVMRPPLLHASSKSRKDLPRRVLHFVFGPAELPECSQEAL